MPRTYSQPFGEPFHSTVLQAAFLDQAESSRNCIRGSEPGRGAGRAFRPATQTRTKAGFRGCRSSRKVADVLLFHCRHGTNRAAIDPGAAHTYEKLAVEAWISRQPGS